MTVNEMLYMVFDFDDDMTCENCPLKEECGLYELYYGCIVWADEMGEDL